MDHRRLVIDADSHKCENPVVFSDYLEPGFRDRLGFFRDRYGEQRFRILDRDPASGAPDLPRVFLQPDGLGKGTYRPYHPETTIGGLFNRVRLQHMEREGIDVQLLYGSITLGFGSLIDPELAVALCRAYNDYVVEDCEPYRDRLHPVAVLPLQDPAAAVAEMRRCVLDLGMPAVTIPPHLPVPHPAAPERFPELRVPKHLSHADFRPLFREAERLDVAIGIHGAPGVYLAAGAADQLDSFTLVHVFANRHMQQVALAKLIFDGVLEEFPRLRVAFLEAGCGWLPDLMHSLHEHWEKRVVGLDPTLEPRASEFLAELVRERSGSRGPGMLRKTRNLLDLLFTPSEQEVGPAEKQRFLYEHPQLARDPLEYLERGQIFVSFEPDDPAVAYLPAALGAAGERVACLAVDYGHWDATLVDCVSRVTDRPGIAAGYADRLLAGNALDLYGERLRTRLSPALELRSPSARCAASAPVLARRAVAGRFDPFRALPRGERAAERSRIAALLAARDGEPDLAQARLPLRDARMRELERQPMRLRGDTTPAAAVWLDAVAKVNQGEDYGARLELERVRARGADPSDAAELHILLEEQMHGRLLAEIAKSCGRGAATRRPPPLMRGLIHAMQHLPGWLRYVPILCGEALGCVVFAALRDAADRFRDQPELAARFRELLDEVVTDETLHALYCRARLGRVGVLAARWLAPLVAASFARDVPELRAIGCTARDMRARLRRGIELPAALAEPDR